VAILLAPLVRARFVANSAVLGSNVLAPQNIRTLADGRTGKNTKVEHEAC
jgi:hypothetical protein